jgi:hypothetical protein
MLFDSISCPEGYSVDVQEGTLDSGETRTVNITFSPKADKIYSGKILIHANTDFGTNYLQVYGTGISNSTSPIILIKGNMNFGKVAIGEKKSGLLTIENIGNAPLYVYGISYPEDFSDEWYNGIIPPNDKVEIEISFSPKKAKSYNGFIEVDCNSVSGSRKFEVQAEGFDPNSIDEDTEDYALSVFPNPASGLFHITSNFLITEYSIFNETGKLVREEKGLNRMELQINIADFPSGIYLCKIGNQSVKIIKQ